MQRITTHAARLFSCVAVLVPTLVVPAGAQSPTAATLMERATAYVGTFVDRFSRVVAEERYVQDSTQGIAGLGVIPPQHRETGADFLLVRTDGAGGWLAFRDVFEVNHVAVRDRGDRLARLFLEAPAAAMSQAQAISRESARYNIGTARTINNPLLPLAFLQDQYRPQFSFSLGKPDRIDGTDVSVLEYREGVRPTLIRGRSGKDLPAHGRYWIDAPSGRILKAEIIADEADQRSRITVSYKFDDRFGVCVPVQMDEEYTVEDSRVVIKAAARYDRFRRFEVTTSEDAR